MARTFVTLVVAGLWLGGPGLAAGQDHQHDHGAPGGRLGTVHFETSCAPAAQKTFDRGVALLHSFWFSAAIKAFDEVLAADPACVMAQWGKAMSWWGNPFAGIRSADALQAVMDENLKANPNAPIREAAQIIDNRAAEAVAASGFLEVIEAEYGIAPAGR